MPEPGGLPRRPRSHDSLPSTRTSGSGRSVQNTSSSDWQAPSEQRLGTAQTTGTKEPTSAASNNGFRETTKRQRFTLWQILFRQDSKRTLRRSALQQAKRKEIHEASVMPPSNLLQRLKPGSKQFSGEQAASKLAENQVRQAVYGRSRQVNSWAPAAIGNPDQQKGKQSTRSDSWRRRIAPSQASPDSGSRSTLGLQASSLADGRAQSLAMKREARERMRRGESNHRHTGADLSDRMTTFDRLKTRAAAQTSKRDTPPQPRSRSLSAGIYAARMLILSVGIGVLVGTMLSVLDPAARSPAGASQQTTKKAAVAETSKAPQAAALAQGGIPGESASATQLPRMGQELSALKASLQTLALQTPQLTPGIFLFDLDTNSYLDLNGGASFAAASTIKVPILVAFFQDVDAGKIRLDELLTMRKDLVAGGSGEMQGLPVGTQFTALETVTKMITISDNTATNMVIARLGGMATLDQRFRSWGLVSTGINNLLPDLNGTNTTSPKDMALLMTRISQGELVSMRSRDRLLDIMQRTVNRSQLPQGLDKGATIAHKTGDIGSMIGDVGLIDMPNGKRYALTVLVKRSFNDGEAYDLVQKVSRMVYQYLNRMPTAPSAQALSPVSPANQSLSDTSNAVSSVSFPNDPAQIASSSNSPLDTTAR
ncbi:MAG: serine hydrolase [Leptolyngbya sp. BL-A-14]